MRVPKIKALDFQSSGFNKDEWKTLKGLSSPAKIQDFLNSLNFNFEKRGETHRSVRYALKKGEAHCFEGALIAAAALWISGQRPLLLDLVAIETDYDHVVTLFKKDGYWGAISKTNHVILRYREPVYKSVRELVMSYFHEYFLFDGTKTLRSFSQPFDLSKLSNSSESKINWLTGKDNLAELTQILNDSRHTKILSSKQARNLRLAEEIEIQAGKIVEYKKW